MAEDSMPRSDPAIFISYASADAAAADSIVKALGEIGLSAWIDRSEIKAGDSFIEKMNQGLTGASYLLLLLSKASVASPWVSREWMSALAKRETVILPVLLEECDIPALLSDIVYVDLRRDRADGLARLRAFFLRERAPAAPALLTRSAAEGLSLRSVSRRALRLLALRCMSDADLQAFLFDADIEAGILQGNSLHERITSLLVRVANDGVLERFAAWLEVEPSCARCVANQMKTLNQKDSWSTT